MHSVNNYNRNRYRLGIWFTAPAVIILLTVLAYPIVASLVLSFLRVRFSGDGLSFEFNGVTNYADLLERQLFREALFRSVYFTVVEVVAVIFLALLVALMLNHPLGRSAIFRVVLLVPWALSPVANAVLWKWIYNANHGVLNQSLLALGIIEENIIWLGKPWLALNMILLADIWKAVPFIALLMLAGLQNIPSYLYKAARLDGANAWQQFVHVTLPGLKTTLIISIVLQSIWALKVFDLIYVLTKGSPADSTVLLNYLSWRETFSNLDVGYGAAIANVLFVLMFMLALVYIRALRPRQTKVKAG
ncbi:MAG TPA: sugar ABC transporter permease [Anaerolineales bacterium]|nr:sugar ABC transporter permease [Anaerolineales bacterium]